LVYYELISPVFAAQFVACRVRVDYKKQGLERGVGRGITGVWSGEGCVLPTQRKCFEVSSKNAFLLRKTTCGQKPDWGLNWPPRPGWKCKMHGGWKFNTEFNSPNQLALWLHVTDITQVQRVMEQGV